MSNEIEAAIRAAFQDRGLSRNERSDIAALVATQRPSLAERARLVDLVFALAEEAADKAGRPLVAWCRALTGALQAGPRETSPAEVFFSPAEVCVQKIVSLLKGAQRSLDVCVFTITDNRISDAILAAHQRGVRVRIVTDNEKAYDEGSDTHYLEGKGVPVRVDSSPFHMHHKFALFDRATLLNGSFNWTRGASMHNKENFIVTHDPGLVAAYQGEFDRLWREFAP